MWVRITTIDGDPARIDDAVRVIEAQILPAIRELQGFTAANFMVDRSTGRLLGIAFWADEGALQASDDALAPLRSAVADAMHGTVVGTDVYELVAQSW